MIEGNDSSEHSSPTTRLLIAAGLVGPLLFIVVFLVEGATRPGYSAWHNFVSSLSLSDQGWEQIANFLICGFLAICFAVGLRRVFRSGPGSVWGPIMVGIFGLALVAAGIFVTDPGLGYPPGESSSSPQSLHGIVHGVAGLVVFCSVSIASFVLARRFAHDPGSKLWALYSVTSGLLVLIFFVASTVASALDENGTLPNAPVGLLQRIAIIAGWGWLALLALRLLGKMRATMPAAAV